MKLQRNNTLTKTIKKTNLKPSKFRNIIKKTGNVLLFSDAVLMITNFFNITNLERVENILTKVIYTTFGYLVVSKTKKLIDFALSNARLVLLCDQLQVNYNIKVSLDSLKNAEIYPKDGVNLIPLDDKALILEVSENNNLPEYSYYIDGEYTNISEVVNNVVLTKHQKRRKNKKTTSSYDNQENKENYKDIKGFLD